MGCIYIYPICNRHTANYGKQGMLKRSGFRKQSYAEVIEKARVKAEIARQKPYKARTAKLKRKPKKSPRAKKMELKREIIEQYGLPMLPCSRYGMGKAPTRQDVLKGMLWHIFSLFIRLRDRDLPCIACGLMKENKQAGHFAPAGGNDLELCFDEKNVNGECSECNADFGGDGWHLIQMRRNLLGKYGGGVVIGIETLKSQKRAVKWEEYIYVEKIKYYFNKVNELQN